jgi:hypothetical protein
MFGGEGNEPTTLRKVLAVILIDHAVLGSSNYENQVASVDGRFRLPGPLPMEAYLEWGFEDTAGAWAQVPGVIGGLTLPALPGLPAVGLGAQYSTYRHSCCDNPPWYRHAVFAEGWTADGRLLGDPLGGEGREWRIRAEAAPGRASVRLRVDGFSRARGEENLFAPEWEGNSLGGAAKLEMDAARGLRLRFDGERESGEDGWSRSEASAALYWMF